MLNDELSLRRIAYLHAAVEQGSVRGAADHLDINASAVSRQIALLEDELSAKLLERHNRGVKPTELGTLLIDYFRAQEAMRRDLLEKIRETRGLERGHIAIRLGAGFVSDLLAGPLAAFHRQHPGISFDIETTGTNEVITSVLEDHAHIGLVYNPGVHADVRSRASATKPLCALMAANHPLAHHASVTMQQISAYPLVMKEMSYGTMQLVAHAARSERLPLHTSVTTNSSQVMFDFVRHSQAVAFGPAFAVAQQLADGTLKALPIRNPLLESAEAHLITRLGRNLPHAAQRLVQHLASSMQAFEA